MSRSRGGVENPTTTKAAAVAAAAAVRRCSDAFVALNDEYQRRLIANNFRCQPSAASLYDSDARIRGAIALAAALRAAPDPVRALLEATSAKHWGMLHNQVLWHVAPLRTLDQALVWLCRDALLQTPPPVLWLVGTVDQTTRRHLFVSVLRLASAKIFKYINYQLVESEATTTKGIHATRSRCQRRGGCSRRWRWKA